VQLCADLIYICTVTSKLQNIYWPVRPC